MSRTLHDFQLAMDESLPGWLWRGGVCAVSSEMWIAPDFNCPVHGERLLAEFDEREWSEGLEIEIRPGSYQNLVNAAYEVMGWAIRKIEAAKPTTTTGG